MYGLENIIYVWIGEHYLFDALSQREQFIIKLREVPFVPRSLYKRGGALSQGVYSLCRREGGEKYDRLTMTMMIVVRIKFE